jgi:hypothetical protein
MSAPYGATAYQYFIREYRPLDEARTLIAASVDGGSELDERAAALAWLEHGRARPPWAAWSEADTLHQLQQRILHRSEVIALVLAGTPNLPRGAALTDLVEDIATAARTLGVVLDQATRG